jgi:hypothetical protein
MKPLLLAVPFLAVLVVAQQASSPQRNLGNVGQKKSTQSPRPVASIGNNIVQVIDSLIAAGAAKGKPITGNSRFFCPRKLLLSSTMPMRVR